MIAVFQLIPLTTYAQNLGHQPQPARLFRDEPVPTPSAQVLNLVNRVGSVISPVVMAVVSFSQVARVAGWAITAGGLLVISGLTRLLEFWIVERHCWSAVKINQYGIPSQ